MKDNAPTFTSPTCVATFADGEVARMTTWSENGKPDLRRGARLVQAAYEQRKRRQPPAITALRFETVDGTVLKEFTTDQIAEVVAKEPVEQVAEAAKESTTDQMAEFFTEAAR
jgi:hypothetical protein